MLDFADDVIQIEECFLMRLKYKIKALARYCTLTELSIPLITLVLCLIIPHHLSIGIFPIIFLIWGNLRCSTLRNLVPIFYFIVWS